MLLIVKEKISKFYGTLMYVCGTCSTLTLQMSYIICKVTNKDNFLCIPSSSCSHVLLSFHYMCMEIVTSNM